MDEEKQIYCQWDCKNDIDFYIMLSNTVIAFLFLVASIRIFLRGRRVLNPGISTLYYGVMAWAIFYIIKNIYSFIIYKKYFSSIIHVQNDDEKIEKWNQKHHEQITQYSAIYLVLDSIPPIILQGLLFQIPYRMIGNVMKIIKSFGMVHLEKERKWYKILTIYKFSRLIIIIPLTILCFYSFVSVEVLRNASIVQVAIICFDCLVCNILLIFTYKYLTEKYKVFKLDHEGDQKKLLQQCILLSLSAFFRFCIDLAYYVIIPPVKDSGDQQRCLAPQKWWYTIGYIIIGSYLMHFFPVFVTLYVYYPRSDKSSIFTQP